MKKIILTLILTLTTFIFFDTYAQSENTGNNWFISAGGGPNILFGEQDRLISLDKRIKFTGEFTIGTWINPYWGIRTQLNIGQLQGWNSLEEIGWYVMPDGSQSKKPVGYPDHNYYCNGDYDGFYQTFYYGSLTADVMLNLMNIIKHDDLNNKFDIIPFAGFGYVHTVKSCTNPTFDGWLAKFGGRINYNLNSKWAIYGEAQGNMADKKIDGYIGGKGVNLYLNILGGIQYKF